MLKKRWKWAAVWVVVPAAIVAVLLFSTLSLRVPVPAEQYQQCLDAARESGTKQAPCERDESLGQRTLTDPIAYFTAWLTIFTGVLAGVGIIQGYLTKRAIDTERSSVQQQLRAFVFLDDFDVRQTLGGQPGGYYGLTHLTFVPKWRNSGETPTRDLRLRLNWEAVEGDLPKDWSYSFKREPVRALIGPKADEYSDAVSVTPPLIIDLGKGLRNLYIWGRADYRDIFEGTPARFTEFCYVLRIADIDGEMTPQFLPYGAYNRTEDSV